VSAQQLLEAMLPFTSYGEMAADDFSRDVRQGTIRAPESVLKLAAESDVSLADVLKRSPTPVKDGRRWVRWAIDAAIVVVATGVIVTGISLFPRGSEEKRRAYDSVAESPLASGKPAIEASPPPKPSGTKPPTSVEGGSPARGPDFVVSSLEGGSQKATLFQGLPSELSLDPARLSLFYRDGESGQQFVGARYCFSSEELARMLGCTPASLENVRYGGQIDSLPIHG
jgi:hypothetical protein